MDQIEQNKHNWMYSFGFADNELYLVGYCKPCENVFSEIIPKSKHGTRMSKTTFPKYGCVPVTDEFVAKAL